MVALHAAGSGLGFAPRLTVSFRRARRNEIEVGIEINIQSQTQSDRPANSLSWLNRTPYPRYRPDNKIMEDNDKKTLVIALTGGVASGKTTVSDRFGELGAPVVDTDVIAREVVAKRSGGLAGIVAEFGPEMLTSEGTLDRPALRRKIFDEPGARTRLEDILHPRIAEESRRQLAGLDAPYSILVVPLLFESGLFSDADRVLVVDVPESVQIERLMKRDESTREQADAMLAAQASRDQRLAKADDVIENTGTLAELNARVEELDRRYRDLSTKQ